LLCGLGLGPEITDFDFPVPGHGKLLIRPDIFKFGHEVSLNFT
jgi:hypothetical protein